METLSTLATGLPSTNIPLPLSDILWMVVLGFVISFILSVAIGANDVANSFETPVGAKVLTLRQALFLATIFETLGAVLIGSKVAETIQKGIFDVELYAGREETLVLGEISALAGCAVWLFVATAFKMPVSTTHSIVGATLGFHFVVFGVKGIQWLQVGLIVLSWVTSPVLSGLFSSVIFIILRHFILKKEEPLEPGLRSLPIWYGLVITVNFFSIFYDGPTTLGFDSIPLWGVFVLSFGSGFLVGLAVWFIMVPYIRKKIIGMSSEEEEDRSVETQSIFAVKRRYSHDNKSDKVGLIPGAESALDEAREETGRENVTKLDDAETTMENEDEAANEDRADKGVSEVQDHPHVTSLCSPLQALSAVFASFAHGGNDVSNAVGPLIAIWLIYRTGDIAQEEPTPLWVLFYGALGISLGLWCLGRRVIQTVGEDITALTPSSGFSVELGAAMTVLLASNIGIPISTTHCKIGSVVSVGWLRSREAVNWSLFGTIVLAWVVTLPATMGLSAAIMALLQLAIR
nr:LOW QUALITY PROTEIN: sodium-dependent phosphate transporter 1-A-like [Lytechinus pictus]